MWTDATREKYEREAHRYASDLSDTEWCVIEPHMPPARALGRPRKTDMREVMTAILYMARSGCQWRMLPGEFPPRSSVQYYFYKWRDDGTWQEVNRALLARTREAEGRAAAEHRRVGRASANSHSKSVFGSGERGTGSRTGAG